MSDDYSTLTVNPMEMTFYSLAVVVGSESCFYRSKDKELLAGCVVFGCRKTKLPFGWRRGSVCDLPPTLTDGKTQFHSHSESGIATRDPATPPRPT